MLFLKIFGIHLHFLLDFSKFSNLLVNGYLSLSQPNVWTLSSPISSNHLTSTHPLYSPTPPTLFPPPRGPPGLLPISPPPSLPASLPIPPLLPSSPWLHNPQLYIPVSYLLFLSLAFGSCQKACVDLLPIKLCPASSFFQLSSPTPSPSRSI